MRRATEFCFIVIVLAAQVVAEERAEVPRSHGSVSKVDEAILRVPFLSEAPKIDGVMQAGEWADASALSAFYYDFHFGQFRFAAPKQTQLQMYAGYDRENLYFCYRSPVYPVGSWMKARGRFPDVLEHPLYGILFDDHKEIELRPLGDLNRGYQIGMLRWDVNPIGTYNDWFMSRDTGRDLKYSSRAMIRSVVDDRYWVIEYAIPFKSLRYRGYDGKDKDGRPMVQIPPANGTVYRAWFARGLGRAGALFNAFDQHGWNTTKMKLIFDSKSPVFQINELGPIMEGKIDLHMTVKNHNDRSEMVRIGFHVESPSGPLYSSYQSEDIRDGLLELRPGEVRKLRLKHQLVGVASDGNTFWFDVRSVGESVKSLFRSRLVGFHMMDGGVAGTPPLTFRERRLDVIKELRPKRVPYFDLRVTVSPYNRRLAAVIDRGIAGVKEEIKTATNAQLHVRHLGKDDEVVHTASAPFIGDFAIFDIQVPELLSGESYEVTVLAFNQNMRIVGEQTETKPFFNLTQGADAATPAGRGERFNLAPWMKTVPKDDPARMYYTPGKEKDKRKGFFESPPWLGLEDGLEDRVWEPFTAIKQTDNGFETLKHRFTIDGSGLPAQIDIRPDPRELPLELRGQDAIVPAETLTEIGRGPQLREPLRLEAVIKGKRVPASVVSRARAMRVGKSEIEYTSKLRIGPIEAELRTQYDCDGSLHAKMVYGSDAPAAIERLELVADVSGRVDLMLSETGNGPGFTGADRGECTLPNKTGVLWDSTLTKMPLFYSRFVPWFWFGSADRGWSYYSSGDEGWILDRDGSAMQIERNESGDVTWRVVFINHPAEVKGRRTIDFSILTHPAKPKPVNFRRNAWHYCAGEQWASQGRLQLDWGAEPDFVPWSYSEENFLKRWRTAANAPADIPEYHREGWRGVDPPYRRWGLGTAGSFFLPEKDRLFQDKALYYLERYIRLGRRLGLWMGDYSPPGMSVNLAMGNSWARDPKDIGKNELPLQSKFLTGTMRDTYKRLLRVQAKHDLPPRHLSRSNNNARMLESFMWNSILFRQTGAEAKAYEIDLITVYPNSLYRTMGMNYTGLITTLIPDRVVVSSGDNPRFDRQQLGLALLHDFGIIPNGNRGGVRGGPQGSLKHQELGVRLVGRLDEFGFFVDANIEKLPFWRNDDYVRMGDMPGDESKVRVTVYRRPLDTGKGYKALFVILNESETDIELPLDIRDPKRVLGGPNTQQHSSILAGTEVPGVLQAAWTEAIKELQDIPALMDLETGVAITRIADKGERYGPLLVPYHDYRILYGYFEE